MTDIHCTWFGPPAAQNSSVPGVPGLVRADIFGFTRLAASTFSGPAPNFIFCCLEEHADAYRTSLPGIEVKPIDSMFEKRFVKLLEMNRKASLEARVGHILYIMLRDRGGSWRTGAFMKDLWSLYCAWKFGGYHVDSGCFPTDPAKAVSFPEPKTFQVVADTAQGSGNYLHYEVNFPSGKTCAALRAGTGAFPSVLENKTQLSSAISLRRNLDVWLLCSPAGHKAARAALEFYVDGWIAIQRATTLTTYLMRANALQALIISSVATAITHAGPGQVIGKGCLGNAPRGHLIDATFNPPRVDAFNLRKFGFGSHR